jgi:glyoxylase-like metal-dependent hydrolase (beta-lactamase superfamily II)
VAIPFVRDLDVEYGACAELTPLIRRVVAKNPSKYTFLGTGTYLLGRGEVAVIDPGPDDDAHFEALLAALEGEQVTHILITHTHRDHSPLAARLKAVTGAPTYGFGPHARHDDWPEEDEEPEEDEAAAEADREEVAAASGDTDPDGAESTERGFDEEFTPDVAVHHGERIDGDGWSVDCVHTPGHTSNHICYGLVEEAALFTGDHIMGWSTTVIGPPDGNMAAYMDSLDVVLDREDRSLWPTHGPPVTDPRPFVAAYRDHRLERDEQILARLRAGDRTIAQMVPVMYADVDRKLHRPAARSVHSHLLRLLDAGVVRCEGDPRLRGGSEWEAAR